MITIIEKVMRKTRQKDAILSAVQTLKTHPTADEIYSSLKQEHTKLSLGTVYRNLNSFTEKGKVRKISIPGFGDRFDFNVSDHEHFICNSCNNVYDIHLTSGITDIVSENGNEITGYSLVVYGRCRNCQTS